MLSRLDGTLLEREKEKRSLMRDTFHAFNRHWIVERDAASRV